MMDDRKKKSKRRLKRKNQPVSYIPSGIVLNAANLADRPGAIELSLLIAIAIVAVYLTGFYTSVMSLPDAPRMPNFAAHRGANFNLPHPSEWDRELKQEVAAADPVIPSHDNLRHLEKVKDTAQVADQAKPEVAPVPQKKEGKEFAPLFDKKKESDSEIPAAKWPVSIRDEADSYETIIHPGDLETEMKVPKFWAHPVHHNGLMSRETAMKIGSCIEPDPVTGSFNRGDACALSMLGLPVTVISNADLLPNPYS